MTAEAREVRSFFLTLIKLIFDNRHIEFDSVEKLRRKGTFKPLTSDLLSDNLYFVVLITALG